MGRGRPKKDITRNQVIKIRLTPDEYDQLRQFTEKNELTVSEFIRDMVKNYITDTTYI